MPHSLLQGGGVQRGGFFRRRELDFQPYNDKSYAPVRAENIDGWAWGPVDAGRWQQHQLWDGTYDLDDLLDVIEAMTVQQENQRRANEAAKRQP